MAPIHIIISHHIIHFVKILLVKIDQHQPFSQSMHYSNLMSVIAMNMIQSVTSVQNWKIIKTVQNKLINPLQLASLYEFITWSADSP